MRGLRERVQRRDERLFALSLYRLLRAKTLRELDEPSHRIEEQVDALPHIGDEPGGSRSKAFPSHPDKPTTRAL
jgi:hypothetical protein